MGVWIGLAVVLFVVGSIMALKPNSKDMQLDKLRMTARKLGLTPKLVACPDWIIGQYGEKGKGMIAEYGLILPNAKLPPCEYQVIDGKWRPYTENYTANFALDNEIINLPESIKATVKGLSLKANFICLYWQENIDIISKNNSEQSENILNQLKLHLQEYANKVQNY